MTAASSAKGRRQTDGATKRELSANRSLLGGERCAADRLIDVTCGRAVTDRTRGRLAEILPEIVSTAIQCSNEPYDENLQPGDVLIRFHDVGPFDRFDIDLLIEVKSKWFVDRSEDRQRRVDEIHAAVHQAASEHQIGVYLTLPVAAWEQTDQQPE